MGPSGDDLLIFEPNFKNWPELASAQPIVPRLRLFPINSINWPGGDMTPTSIIPRQNSHDITHKMVGLTGYPTKSK